MQNRRSFFVRTISVLAASVVAPFVVGRKSVAEKVITEKVSPKIIAVFRPSVSWRVDDGFLIVKDHCVSILSTEELTPKEISPYIPTLELGFKRELLAVSEEQNDSEPFIRTRIVTQDREISSKITG